MTEPFRGIPSVLYESRYCNQEEFDVFICGGSIKRNVTNEVTELKGPDIVISTLRPMLTKRYLHKSAVVGSDIYILGGYDENYSWTSSFEMYSIKKKHWKNLSPVHFDQEYYSVCSFMQSIYVIGGYFRTYHEEILIDNYDNYYKNDCYKYDTKGNKWYQVACLQTKRSNSACTVFEGKVVVTGGFTLNVERSLSYHEALKSVESYDHHDNKWTCLSDLNTAKSYHISFSMGSKLFVIDSGYLSHYEVYDKFSRKFTMFTFNIPRAKLRYIEAFGVNDDIFIFDFELNLYLYNINKKSWTSKGSILNCSLKCAAFQKYPKF